MKIFRFITILCGIAAGLTTYADAGTFRILAVRVEFPYEDPDHDTTTGRGVFDLRNYYDESETAVRNEYHNPWDVPPHNIRYFENHLIALKNYWNTVSEGRVDISYEVWPKSTDGAYTMSNRFYKYGNGRTKEQTNEKLVGLLSEALNACKAAEGNAIDFSDYDTFMIIHAGIGSETSGQLNDIPSAFITPDDVTHYLASPLVIDGKAIDNGIIVPEMAAANGYGGLNGIMAQMFGHRLGLPSMSNNKDGLPAAGGWCLMDTGSMSYGAVTRGFVPTHPCMWSKIALGWIAPVVVTTDTTLDIAATHINNGLPRGVKIPINSDEYLLIENRLRYASRDSLPEVVFSDSDSSGVWLSVNHYDAFIPGSGILIWHINESIIAEKRAAGEINDDIYRRGIDLLEADGIEDIGALMGFGDPRGDYSEGHDDDTYKSNGVKEIDPFTRPNTGSMWGGNSGITITVNSEPGEVMNITIAFSGKMPGFPVAAGTGGHITSFDVDHDGIDELIASNAASYNLFSSKGDTLIADEIHTAHPAALTLSGTTPALYSGKGETISYLYSMNGAYTVSDVTPDTQDGYTLSLTGNPVTVTDATGSELSLLSASFYDDEGTLRRSSLFVINATDGSSRYISLPDTATVQSLAAAYPNFAVRTSGAILYIGSLSDDSVERHILDNEISAGPVMADFDRSGVYQTVVITGTKMYIFEPDGSSKTVMLPSPPVGDPAIADIDLDGYPEMIVASGDNIYAFRRNGVPVNGFPFRLPPGDSNETIISSPIIADLDGDRDLDIAFSTSDMRIVSFDVYGAPTRGFPIATSGKVTEPLCAFRYDEKGSIALAYVTTDGVLGAFDLKISSDEKLRPWAMWRGASTLASSLHDSKLSTNVRTSDTFNAYCYPNPITGDTGTFRVVPVGPTDLTVAVYTADGIKVFEKTMSKSEILPGVPNEMVMNASGLASGLYIAKITTKQKSVFYKLGVLK